jgi:hypothetical protein
VNDNDDDVTKLRPGDDSIDIGDKDNGVNSSDSDPSATLRTANGGGGGGGGGVYKCNFCDYVASLPRYKVLHEKRVHLHMDCKICGKMFKDQTGRESHVCVKPDRFQCTQCEKSYKVKGELKKHVDIIHR